MNYTTNYHLPQWVESDRIMMEDFNEAMADIDQGLTEAYSPDNLPYVIGSYNGNGGTQDINLGFQPRFLFITSQIASSSKDCIYLAMTGGNDYSSTVTLKDFGFSVMHGSMQYPYVNVSGRIYRYMAIR